MNKRVGTDFNESDKLFFEQVERDFVENEQLKTAVNSNTQENFKYVYDDVFMNVLIGKEQNKGIFSKIIDDKEFVFGYLITLELNYV